MNTAGVQHDEQMAQATSCIRVDRRSGAQAADGVLQPHDAEGIETGGLAMGA